MTMKRAYTAPTLTVAGSLRAVTLANACGEHYDDNYYRGELADGQLLSGPNEYCLVPQP